MSAASESSMKFWDKKAEKYAKQAIDDQEAYEKKLELTQAYFTPETKVFEFGCGTGSTALIHAPHVKHIVATDISQKMLDIARQKAQEEGITNVDFQRGTLEDLSYPPESFDVVLGLNIIHLLDDIDGAMKKCYDLLKPGGVFVSSTVCISRANAFFRFILPIGGKLGVIPKLQYFDLPELESKITRAGFRIKTNELLNKSGMTSFIIAQK